MPDPITPKGLMTLELFVFELATLPFQELSRSNEWRHASTERFGARPVGQYLGPGPEKISLPGTLYPGQIGNYNALGRLRTMADAGDAYQLMTGFGEILGDYVIIKLDEKQSFLMVDGAPRKIDFTIELERFEP